MTKKKELHWLRVSDASKYYYKLTGIMPCVQSVRNWMRKGKRGYDGSLIKLRSKRAGNLFVTSKEWIDIFAERMSCDSARAVLKEDNRRRRRDPIPPLPD